MKPLVVDMETSISSDKYRPHHRNTENDIYSLISGDHPDRISVVHKENGFNRTLPQGLLNGFDVVVGVNLSFDLSYIWHDKQWQEYLINENNSIWCCAEAEYILSGQRHRYPSLAELQEIYLGEKIKEDRISKLFKSGIGANKIIHARIRCPRVFALYELYCEGDGSSTLRIFAAQYRRAKKEGCLKLIQSRMKGLLAIILMQNTWMHINVVNCEKTLREFKLNSIKYLKEATEFTKHLWDERLPPFNINSFPHKSAILFGGDFITYETVKDGFYTNGNQKYKKQEKIIHIAGYGLPTDLTVLSKKDGCYRTGKEIIEKIYKRSDNAEAKEYCRLQKMAMKYGKMASTYLEPFLNYNIDGVLYPNFNTTATETSRLSSNAPNFQNIPASGEMLLPIQGQIIAPDGWVCVEIDYCQLEPYITAMLSKDAALTHDLLNDVCLHCRAVSWIPRLSEGKTYEEIYQLAKIEEVPEWVLKRKKAKGINFKRAYGGGAKSLAEAEDLDIKDVQAVFESQDVAYPAVKQFTDALYAALPNNQQLSRKQHFSKSSLRLHKFAYGMELLPIYDGQSKMTRMPDEYRHYGSYTSMFGHKFTFEEMGHINKWGQIRRRYSTTETKNYQIQGTAGDIVQLALAECMYYVLRNKDEVRMVNTIHDAICFYVKKGTEALHVPVISGIMEGIRHLVRKYLDVDVGFDFKVEAKIGENFAELEVYKTTGE